MTHAQALGRVAGDRSTLATCGGELEPIDSVDDSHVGKAGPIKSRIEVYRCCECGRRLSICEGVLLRDGLGPDGPVKIGELLDDALKSRFRGEGK